MSILIDFFNFNNKEQWSTALEVFSTFQTTAPTFQKTAPKHPHNPSTMAIVQPSPALAHVMSAAVLTAAADRRQLVVPPTSAAVDAKGLAALSRFRAD
jgi:ABC-type antimicrobial peptide transport system ATPase subunit